MDDKKKEQELTYLLDKTFECPVCFKSFKAKQVKTGRARFQGTDEDLRPRYLGIDTIKYDVILCPHCGYSAVLREFNNLTAKQRESITEGIARRFAGVEPSETVYEYEEAIYRYKMAVLTAMTKPAKLSEVAYLGLKLSWLYRGALEEMEEEQIDNPKLLKAYTLGKDYYKKESYKEFVKAVSQEYAPICGMDEDTINYLLAVLAYDTEDFENAQKFAYSVLGSASANAKLKNKVRELVDKLKAVKKTAE